MDDLSQVLQTRLPPWLSRKIGCSELEDLSVERLAGGYSNETWKISTRYHLGGQRGSMAFVLRWAPPGGVSAPYDIPGQFALMRALANTPIPTAEPLWLEADPAVLGQPFLTMKVVGGATAPRAFPFDDPLREEKLRSYVRALASIHNLDWKAYGVDQVLPAPPPGTVAQAAIEGVLTRIAARGSENDPRVKRAVSWLLERAPACSEVQLIHGDPNISNYRFDSTSVVAILDWEAASLSEPLWDVGVYSGGLRRRHPEDFKTQSRERELFLGLYSEFTGRSFEVLDYWEVMYFLRAAVTTEHPGMSHVDSSAFWEQLAKLTA